MKKIALAEENYRQVHYFIPTNEQLCFDTREEKGRIMRGFSGMIICYCVFRLF